MAGHSHSSNIKFRKDRVDQKRAKLFSKLSRMITVAARQGGAAEGNPKLRLALEKARVASMSREAIERAIKKGTGEGAVGDFEEILYEGYGPGGVAILLEILTDKRSRTAPEVRHLFEDAGGNLAASGSVAWMFQRRGLCHVDASSTLDADRLLEVALAAGAEDLVVEAGSATVLAGLQAFAEVKAALERAGVPLRLAELAWMPEQRTVVADVDVARRVVALLEALDDHDDVQAVHDNAAFPADVEKALAEEA
jgi:YebC/PmpR family DNA-binding regulatory protein